MHLTPAHPTDPSPEGYLTKALIEVMTQPNPDPEAILRNLIRLAGEDERIHPRGWFDDSTIITFTPA